MRWAPRLLICLTLLVTLAFQLSGQTCLHYERYLQVVNLLNDPFISYSYNCVAQRDSYLYTGCDDQWVRIYGIGEAGDLIPVLELNTSPYIVNDIRFVDDLAIMGTSESGGILIYDITGPTAPELMGSKVIPGETTQVVLNGYIACVASDLTSSGTLSLVDVSDPERPELLATVETAGQAMTVTAKGDHVYVATAYPTYSLQIFEISDPAAPVLIETITLSTTVGELKVDDDFLFLVGGSIDLRIYDLSLPADPQPVGELLISGKVSYGLAILGDEVFLCQGQDGGQLVDISDLTNPAAMGTVQFPDGDCRRARGHEGLIYTTLDDAGLAVINYEGTETPQTAAAVTLPYWYEPDESTPMEIGENHVYVGSYTTLYIVDISESLTPQYMSQIFFTGHYFNNLAVNEPYVYLSLHDALYEENYWRIVDVSDPSAPVSVSTWDEGAGGTEIHCMGDYLILPIRGGVAVHDVSDPQSPGYVSSYTIAEASNEFPEVSVSGRTVFMAMDESGFYSVDFSDIPGPQIMQHLPAVTSGRALDRVGDLLYHFSLPGFTVTTIDVGDPADMIVLGYNNLDLPDYLDMTITESHAYFSSVLGLKTFELSEAWIFDPVALTNWWGISNTVGDEMLYTVLGSQFTCLYPQCTDQVAVDPVTPVPTLITLDAWPNPFNPRTMLSFNLERSGRTRLSVHDLSGREVAILADRFFESGTHDFRWQAATEGGHPLPSGVYFGRLEQAGALVGRKLVLLR
jgi:hypothetical protein